MIGIDLVNVTRFENSRHLSKFLKRFNVNGTTAITAAKTWACLEAIVKAEPRSFCPTDIHITFPAGQAPILHDPKQTLSSKYALSISHEDCYVVAVAVKI